MCNHSQSLTVFLIHMYINSRYISFVLESKSLCITKGPFGLITNTYLPQFSTYFSSLQPKPDCISHAYLFLFFIFFPSSFPYFCHFCCGNCRWLWPKCKLPAFDRVYLPCSNVVIKDWARYLLSACVLRQVKRCACGGAP